MTNSINVGYGIMAGGLSSRMGEDKAFLDYMGQPLIKHIADIIGSENSLYVSVSDNNKSIKCTEILGSEAIMLPDEIKEYGPLEGLYQLLGNCTEDALFIMAVDMPLITKELLTSVLKVYDNEDVLVLRSNDRIHPLFGIYSKRIYGIVNDLRNQDIHKIMRIYDKCNTRIIDIEELGFSVDVLANINTREDYERLLLKK